MCMNRRENVSPPWLQTTVAYEREDEEEIKHLSLADLTVLPSQDTDRIFKARIKRALRKLSSQPMYIYFIVFKKPQGKG
ncbi:unnamed protein product [Camellia sinensis]